MLKWTHKTQLSTFVPFGSIPSFLSKLEEKRQICCDESPPIKFGDIFLPMNPRLPLISSKSVGFSADIVQVVGGGVGVWFLVVWWRVGLVVFVWKPMSRATGGKQGFPKEKKTTCIESYNSAVSNLVGEHLDLNVFFKHFAICFRDSEEFGSTGIAGSASWNM